jgi:hypothetical protein
VLQIVPTLAQPLKHAATVTDDLLILLLGPIDLLFNFATSGCIMADIIIN